MCQHVPTTSKAFRGKNRCFAFPVGPGRLCWAQKFEILGRTDFGWFFHDDGLFWDGILDDVFLILDGFRMRISWRWTWTAFGSLRENADSSSHQSLVLQFTTIDQIQITWRNESPVEGGVNMFSNWDLCRYYQYVFMIYIGWYDIIWYHMIWYDVIWYDMRCILYYCILLYITVYCGILLYISLYYMTIPWQTLDQKNSSPVDLWMLQRLASNWALLPIFVEHDRWNSQVVENRLTLQGLCIHQKKLNIYDSWWLTMVTTEY